jgi:hypothetical protein
VNVTELRARIYCLRHRFKLLNGMRDQMAARYHALPLHEERQLIAIAEEIARLHRFINEYSVNKFVELPVDPPRVSG